MTPETPNCLCIEIALQSCFAFVLQPFRIWSSDVIGILSVCVTLQVAQSGSSFHQRSCKQHRHRAMDPSAQPVAATTASRDGDVGADCSPPSLPALKPWEQHGGVINMPRYLYSSHAAPLLHRSGFLITCAFRKFLTSAQVPMLLDHFLWHHALVWLHLMLLS